MILRERSHSRPLQRPGILGSAVIPALSGVKLESWFRRDFHDSRELSPRRIEIPERTVHWEWCFLREMQIINCQAGQRLWELYYLFLER